MTLLTPIVLLTFPACLLAAAVSDMRRFIIPNSLSAILAIGYYIAALIMGAPLEAIMWHTLVGLAMFAACFGLFAAGVFGGGDAKLLIATSLWFGPAHVMPAVVAIAIAGGVLAIIMIALKRFARMFPSLSVSLPALARLAAADNIMAPYGVAIAAGSLIAFTRTLMFQTAFG